MSLENTGKVTLDGTGAGDVDRGWVECGGVETPSSIRVSVDIIAVSFDWRCKRGMAGRDGGEDGEEKGNGKECDVE